MPDKTADRDVHDVGRPESSGAPVPDDVVAERRRALVRRLVGHKVSVSTTDLHHVVGRLIRLQAPLNAGERAGDSLVILVNNEEVHVRLPGVVRIHEADPAIAEYVK